MLRWQREEVFKQGYFWIPLLIIMCPTFPSIIGFGNQLVFVLNIILLIWFGYIGGFKARISPGIIVYGCYFVGIACWDVYLEMINNKIEPNDFLEIFRPFGFLCCYLFYRYSSLPVTVVEERTLKMIYWVFSIISIFCILEFIFPEPIREISFFLWKRREVPILKTKAIGPFFQTYNCAYALLIPLFLGFISVFKCFKLKNILFFLMLLCTLLLTQSRSMYVCTVIGFLVCVFTLTNFKSAKSLVRTTAIALGAVFVLVSIYFAYEDEIRLNLGYAIKGLEAMSQGNSSSMNTRQEQIEWSVENNIFPFIGGGMGKGEILLESVYALYYFRYGWIGLCIFFILVCYTAITALKVSKRVGEPYKTFYQSLFVFFVMNPVALSSSCHMDMPKTCLLFYGMMGLVFYRNKVIEDSKLTVDRKNVKLKKRFN